MAQKEDIARKVVGDKPMGLKSDMDSNFWYLDSTGEWRSISELTEITISIDEEGQAALARLLVPLGELEIADKGEE